ncbi:MAG TPA: PQQ-dependent sugar dehydrogenase [Acidobacteriota bacterium]|nr:PQQ-dependent sugar dehydrogenase [Acidobacteriota bacterium]
MIRSRFRFMLLLLGALLAAFVHADDQQSVVFQEIVSGLVHPLYVTAPDGDPRLFIVEQQGRIRIVKDGKMLPKPFLDLTDRVAYGGERGLLSVAFHPHYAQNGFLYVNYTDKPHGDTHIERYQVTKDADVADPDSAKLILKIEQPYANHNGGHNLFGPDGMLYIGMGDGGSAGDPKQNGQNLGSLLGKLLRIDIDHGDPYAIPKDNPFAGSKTNRQEIWAWGLRNPWRFAFDSQTGLLYIADVGQNKWEEVDVVPAKIGALNFGWNVMESNHCFKSEPCNSSPFVPAALEYEHHDGCCVIGGFVYRGKAVPSLTGQYFYADYCLSWIRSFGYSNGKVTDRRKYDFGEPSNVLSFGEDSAHELYVCYANGRVYKIVPKQTTTQKSAGGSQ